MPIEDLLNEIEANAALAPNLRVQLSASISELIIHHFSELVQLLYRVDVSEKKLKTLLATNIDTDAAELITDMLLDRWKEKQISRQQFRFNADDIPPEERW